MFLFVRQAEDDLYWVGELPLRRTGLYTADGNYVSGDLTDAGQHVPEALAFEKLMDSTPRTGFDGQALPNLLTLPRPF